MDDLDFDLAKESADEALLYEEEMLSVKKLLYKDEAASSLATLVPLVKVVKFMPPSRSQRRRDCFYRRKRFFLMTRPIIILRFRIFYIST